MLTFATQNPRQSYRVAFQTTRWGLVLAAGNDQNQDARPDLEALAKLGSECVIKILVSSGMWGGHACRGERGPTGHRLCRRSLVPEFTANDAC